MINIKYTLNTDNYVDNFAIVGDLPESKSITITDFDIINYDCYKFENGELIWDEGKYQKKINNPTLNDLPISEIEILTNYVLDVDMRLIMLELGLI